MYFPRTGEAPAVPAPSVAPSAELPFGHERVLIVEDEDEVREVPVEILRQQGYEVEEAADSPAAINALDARHFDILFTNIVLLGGIDGLEISRRALELQPNIKILYTTGSADNAQRDQLPGAQLLEKPYRRRALLNRVREALDD
jgi:CheY-like chemotaxis protein